MTSVVQHLPAQNRYVFAKDGIEVGLTDYQLVDRDIHITHTEVDPSVRRNGLASEMVQAVLDQGFWAAFTLYPKTKMGSERMVEVVRRYGQQRIIV